MKTKKIIFIVLTLCIIITASAIIINKKNNFTDNSPLVFKKGSTYEDVWKKVDEFEKKNLPKSALMIVESIYKKAKQDTNYSQIIKSIIYKQKYKISLEENPYQKIVNEMKAEIDSSYFPLKPVLHSLLADVYWSFYQANRWKFYNRTETSGFLSEDINTWDIKHIIAQSAKHFKLSLQNADSLKRTKLGLYDDILTKDSGSKHFRPTLYDFLAHRAVNFMMNSESEITKPANNFKIDKKEYFNPAKEFIKFRIECNDTMSLKYYAIKILQDLLLFHSKDDNLDAFIDVDMKRLSFAHQISVHPEKDTLYFYALKALEKKHIDKPISVEISYQIALQYQARGLKYQPLISNDNKWFLKKSYDYSEEAIKRFPKSTGAGYCKVLQQQITEKSVNFNIEAFNQPGKPCLMYISYKNTDKLYFRLIKTSKKIYYNNIKNLYGDDLFKYLSKLKPVKEWDKDLKNHGDYQIHNVEKKFPELEFGYYLVLASPKKDFSPKKNAIAYGFTQITNIAYTSRKDINNAYDFYVFNRETGEPLSGVAAILWKEKYDYTSKKYKMVRSGTYNSNKDGYFHVSPKSKYGVNFDIEFIKAKDKLFTNEQFYIYKPYKYNERKYVVTHFFTDRGIYRPGQTIYFKGIVMEKEGEHYKILPNYTSTICLYDVNYQKQGDIKLTSNEYGTISGTFTIPQGVLTGQMQISNVYGYKYFSVEEYKRPKFEVTFEPVEGSYKLNEKVTAKGLAKAYAGSNIDGADVKYEVKRSAYFPYRWYWWSWYYPTSEETVINYGTTTTNEKGEFEIEFKAVPDLSVNREWKPSFIYTITADVTDINGETHSSTQSVNVGYTALLINTDLKDKVNNKKIKQFELNTTNLGGEFIPAKGNIVIYKLKKNIKLYNKRLWSEPDIKSIKKDEYYKTFPYCMYSDEDNVSKLKKEKKVFEKTFDIKNKKKNKIKLNNISTWAQGKYLIEIKSKDIYGEDIEYQYYFTLYNPTDTKVAVNKISWFTPVKRKCEPGEKAQFLIGSADKDVKVIFEIEHKEKIIYKEWFTLNNEQKLIEIPVEEKHRGNFAVHFVMVKHNRSYEYNELIKVPYSNKELDITFETFRNKLYPGQKEEWRIKIKGPKGEKVAAEMLATLYDASLDAFSPNNWHFDIYKTYHSSMNWYGSGAFTSVTSYLLQNDWNTYNSFQYRYYDRLNWFGFNYGRYYYDLDYTERNIGGFYSYALEETGGRGDISDKRSKYKSSDITTLAACEKDAETTVSKLPQGKAVAQTATGGFSGEENGKMFMPVKVRKNFSETAFFFPQLETNEQGEIIIKFTVPEALTKWKMLGFAHTKDLKFGLIDNELITQKELMVMPNVPRFMRENDVMTLSAKVSNISKNDLSGKAQLFLFDALTMKPVDVKFKNNNSVKAFTVKAEQSTNINWTIKVTEGVQAVTYRFTAQTSKFSDGEENTIPVLTNRMLVTETMPMPVRGNETKEFKFLKLINSGKSKTLKNHKLTLEFTANPAWYAIQALPYIIEYPYECAEQVFSRYYGNSIASHIANSSPKIKKVFDSWKNTPKSKALLSNLEKNQELKSLMLEETPWVLDAQDESQRKRRVGLLFDLNNMANNLNSAKRKLGKLQASNGGWVWFKGGPDDRYITQHIITGFGHLEHLGVKDIRNDYKIWQMVTKGISYLDNEIRKDYEWIKKHYDKDEMKKDHISNYQIQYLYARSYFIDISIPSQSKEAFNYFKAQAAKYWINKNRYMQGMLALGLNRYEDKNTPVDIIKSLKEIAQTSEEMGMYWKDNNSGYYWYQAPIETHSLLIEAFDEILKDKKVTDDLRVWLLKQKQTQDWKTTKATTEAVYALLLRGTDWLATESAIEIMVGDININPKEMPDVKVEAGTGYFKTSWSSNEIKPKMGNVKVTKKDQGVSWGALYWQYFEQLDKITTHKTPLKLEKQLFKEVQTSSGKVIKPISNNVINVGDKVIVRIELRVDRRMEYVHMKDMRAACFEPLNVISQYKYQDGLGYYESTKDVSTNFFFSHLNKGTYVFEYPLWVTHKGNFSNGITSIQCMYAPEFASHSEGIRVEVK
jgi:uncharacterized protein YfaS (alpha-2-macroglobulin family)